MSADDLIQVTREAWQAENHELARLRADKAELVVAMERIADRFSGALYPGSVEWNTREEALAAVAKAKERA